ncbi:contact-dependent growth inhibition system immunity protein [Luteibacter sp. ME-Dv--P-043b]|uniref:contact-dependent growth inhibition system immunity protein n=1 Tax=Luteibacter sp. ME-Dv--P-043b TaxID=3040291 RepID=UPI00255591D8|nr:contact-dependent growth inhibition system immunity protein [Luteibacter sp. ME-Dv--P-043b]
MSADLPFPSLAAMMGHCFHQDMDLEAETVPEAVAQYVRGLTGEAGRALQADIESFRQQHADDLNAAFLRAFGDDLDPREVGLSVGDFLKMVEALVDYPASFRQFLEEDLNPEFPQLRRFASARLHPHPMGAEARRIGRSGVQSMPNVLAIHLGALPRDHKRAFLDELQQFEDRYGDRASQVFGKRWLDLKTSGFGGFREFRQFAELLARASVSETEARL